MYVLLVEDKAFGGGKKALKTKETQLTLLQHKGEHPVHVNTSNEMVWSFVFDSRGSSGILGPPSYVPLGGHLCTSFKYMCLKNKNTKK